MSAAPPPAAGAPVLLVNPRSFRASRRKLAGRAASLARRDGIETILASDPAGFRAAIGQLHARRQQQVWLLTGDGTVHWIAEYLARLDDGWAPALLPLGGGRANVVPRECGGYPALPALRRALAAHRAGRPLAQGRITTLKLEQPGLVARHGFLLAGGMVHEGVRLCSEHRERGSGWIHRSFAADFYVLLKLLLQAWIGRSPLPPYTSMSVRGPAGQQLDDAPMRILLASTLGMRQALYNPFAAAGEGPVRITAIAATAPRFWRRLPRWMKGRFDPAQASPQGVLSGRCERAEVRGISACSLDGENIALDPGQPLAISAGIALTVMLP